MSNIITLDGVTKIYKRGIEEVHALDGISLSIAAGEYTAICGPSGSGKTTLLNVAGCMDHPTAGRVFVENQEVEAGSEAVLGEIRRSTIGFVFQQFFLIPTLTVQQNVALPLLFSHHKKEEEEIAEILRRVGLGHRMKHLPRELSGGEMQRVAVARSLVNDPKVILADEPTGNLDTKNAEAVIELFEDLNSGGIAVIMVTHNTELAKRCGKVVSLEDGKIIS
ncbi:ABC transporter ATP-binding protein [Chitinivibrio alkaliphilus]|uniref:ABC-type transport system, lipoprotein releasing system, ATP-binding protein n=1 Tax=Chitinivibrio alkaliphilus ACht1 TaxID=1313304 RepID=U7D8H2_9BACT|nr:ABC transporter ATP-binding protein [Chitinivibrio alkaliphilus]ERP31377.1 ABC-type transport system, lipoprotein releasing system, ATP-binding protein [Chitinivibrio alkaliphilus ACht1]